MVMKRSHTYTLPLASFCVDRPVAHGY